MGLLIIGRMDRMCEKYGRESVSILEEKKNNNKNNDNAFQKIEIT